MEARAILAGVSPEFGRRIVVWAKRPLAYLNAFQPIR